MNIGSSTHVESVDHVIFQSIVPSSADDRWALPAMIPSVDETCNLTLPF